jgi:N-acetylmuramoyl-L-alanine amidase
MSKTLVIIDAGHGGIKNGVYTTAPAKMHVFPDGFVYYEGVVNRKILKLVQNGLTTLDIDHTTVSHDIEDTSLMERVKLANSIWKKNKNAYLVSIHSNAGGGSGNEIYTSIGETKSDKIADIFCLNYQQLLPQFPFRKDTYDGDDDKEANFYVISKTLCPAVLVENLFFDRRSEADFLSTTTGQQAIANCIIASCLDVEGRWPL